MEKIKFIPSLMVFSFFCKMMIIAPSSQDAIIMSSLCILSSIFYFVDKNNKNEQIKIELNELNKKNCELLDKHSKELEDLKTQIASVRLSSGFRNVK